MQTLEGNLKPKVDVKVYRDGTVVVIKFYDCEDPAENTCVMVSARELYNIIDAYRKGILIS